MIVFQFLALQLQSGNDPALGGTAAPSISASHHASAPTSSTGSPVVTRTSTGVQSTPVSNPTVAAGTQATASPTASRSKTHHSVVTSASGSAGHGGNHSDDLD